MSERAKGNMITKIICFLVGHKGRFPQPKMQFLNSSMVKKHVVGFHCARCGARVERTL